MDASPDAAQLAERLRDVPDFPKPGIVFKDLTPLLADVEAFATTIAALSDHAKGLPGGVDAVVGIEARGFIFGAAVAHGLGAAFVPVRKPGKLPWKTVTETYELEYGTDSLEVHEDAFAAGRQRLRDRRRTRHGRYRRRHLPSRRTPRCPGRRHRLRRGVGIPRRQGETSRHRRLQPHNRVGGVVPTVDRVLPWRRNHQPPADEVAPLLTAYRRRHPKAPTALITRAYLRSADAHRGQLRNSGEPYVHHPLAVASIVAELGLDDVTVAAALLHDTVEDTGLTLDEVRRGFGADVADIVDGVTKLERIQFDSREAQQAATMRKMLVAMAKDLRVLIIKLADRLHNMRTIAAMPPHKQERISRETLDIYAPLAHRLGMQHVKTQLEDLAFAAMHPKRYAEIDHMVSVRSPERDIYLTQVLEEVRQRLAELRITAEVTGRPKHLYSVYEKMVVKGREFNDIFDLVGLRIIVESVKDCYAALGSIHATWKPVQGRFKDYVAMPKFNLYQSLHTTVIGPQGKPLEVQIRTAEMHARAEQGVAAHWQYKEGDNNKKDSGDLPVAQPHHRLAVGDHRPRRVHAEPEDRPRAGRGLRLHPQGQGRDDADGGHAHRLRLLDPHRGGPRLHRRPGQRPAGAARLHARLG